MVVLLPGATETGFAAQVAAAALSVQLTLTLAENPLGPATATVYVAEAPEFTLTLVGAAAVIVKSGPLPVTVKF
jgi:hypothetical protein